MIVSVLAFYVGWPNLFSARRWRRRSSRSVRVIPPVQARMRVRM